MSEFVTFDLLCRVVVGGRLQRGHQSGRVIGSDQFAVDRLLVNRRTSFW